MPLKTAAPVVAASFLAMFAIHGSGVAAEAQVRVTVDPSQTHQTMDGFGASGAWWPTWVGDYPQAKQEQLLDLLFAEEGGIALSIYRYNLPAGSDETTVERPERRTPMIETSPGVYDLAADQKGLDLLAGVRERGVDHFVIFSNSPPPRLTISGMSSGGPRGTSNLKPDSVDDFATYVLDLSTLIRDRYDLPHVAISPVNEPQWTWGRDGRSQEGSHYEPDEVAAVIRATIEENLARDAGFEIEAPESGEWKSTMPYAKALFDDPIIDEHLGELAIHSYWTSPEDREKAARELREAYPDKQIAMTEYCEMRHGHGVGIDEGLHMAEVVHEDLTVGNVVSWQWWLGVAAGGYNDGLVYAHPETQEIETTKRLWILGQWSKFVRPGYIRVEATSADSRLKVTSFLSPDGSRLATVMVNPTDEDLAASVVAEDFEADARASYQTTAEADLAELDAVDGDISLPAKSVTTIVLDRHEAGASATQDD